MYDVTSHELDKMILRQNNLPFKNPMMISSWLRSFNRDYVTYKLKIISLNLHSALSAETGTWLAFLGVLCLLPCCVKTVTTDSFGLGGQG